jgi:hypothetical protein
LKQHNLYGILKISDLTPLKFSQWIYTYHKNDQTKGTDIWWEAPMEGSVLSFLKAE